MTRPQSILKLSEDNKSKELEFELEYLRSLSFEERLTMILSASGQNNGLHRRMLFEPLPQRFINARLPTASAFPESLHHFS